MITFLGCGPSNLFSVLHLLNEGFLGKEICIIDKGKNIYERKPNDLLEGFLGAGGFSDGKYIFSNQTDTISNNFSNREKYHQKIKELILQFLPKDQIDISLPKKHNLDLGKFKLREAECWHLGTNYNLEIGKKMYDYMLSKGVLFLWGEEVKSIDLDNNKIYTKERVYNYQSLQIGFGKIGIPLIKNICKLNDIKQRKLPIHIGGRFETIYNKKIKELTQIQYDFKLVSNLDDNIEIRTFCVNNKAAYVVQEKIKYYTENRIQYNGHAYNKAINKINNLTNFGIIAEIHSMEPEEEISEFLSNYENCYCSGKNWDMDKSSINNLNIAISEYPKHISTNQIPIIFLDFIQSLNEILQLEDKWCFFLPEVKINGGMLDLDEYFRVKDGRFSNVGWVGDSCTGTRGIVPAAITGIKSINRLLNK